MTTETTTPDRDLLDEILERYRQCGRSADIHVNLDGYIDSANDVPTLLAVVGALRNVAAECDQKSAKLWEQISGELGREGVGPELRACSASAYSNAASMIREAVSGTLAAAKAEQGVAEATR